MMIVLVFISGNIFARDLFDFKLGLSGIYDATSCEDFETFLEGMGDGKNWAPALNVGLRFLILDVSLMALPDATCVDGMELLSSLGLSLPVVTDFVYLGLGAGIGTGFTFPEDGRVLMNGREVSEANLTADFLQRPIHLRFGLDFMFGPAILGFTYIKETGTTLEGLQVQDGWAGLLEPGVKDRFGVSFQLALL